MTELSSRFITSLVLLLLAYLSTIYLFILLLILIFCLYEILFEFNFILKKIYKNCNHIKIYISFIFILFFITFSIVEIFSIFALNKVNDKLILFLIISICISTDIGGFTFGKILKGKKLTRISPNKTYSGLIGSYIISYITSVYLFKNYFTFYEIILFTIIFSTISQIGDLFISFLKRKANIKDTGKVLPGHGGILDRLDGIIFTIPIGLIFFYFYA